MIAEEKDIVHIIGRHLVNINEMCISGSIRVAVLFI